MIRVLIADDHQVVRGGLRATIQEQPDMSVCGELADASRLVAEVSERKPDVVVLDINMPGSGSTSLVREIRSLANAPQVVIFTMYNEDSHAVGYLREGAAAFINKRRSTEELLRAVRRAAAGSRYTTNELQEFLFENQIDPQKQPLDLLSAREVQGIRPLAAGKRATEIASELGLSTSTVNTFVERVKTKLGLRTTVEIVLYATQNGLTG